MNWIDVVNGFWPWSMVRPSLIRCRRSLGSRNKVECGPMVVNGGEWGHPGTSMLVSRTAHAPVITSQRPTVTTLRDRGDSDASVSFALSTTRQLIELQRARRPHRGAAVTIGAPARAIRRGAAL